MLSINFQYRLSPHVTFWRGTASRKVSNVFNQPDLGSAGAVSGGTQVPNQSVIAPIADRSTIPEMWVSPINSPRTAWSAPVEHLPICTIPNQSEVPAFLIRLRRADRRSIRFGFRRCTTSARPTSTNGCCRIRRREHNETQTHALLLFYTLYPTPRFSISLFGGPQYADSGPQFIRLRVSTAVAGIPKLESGGWRQLELAGTPEQPGRQLLAH